MGHVARRSRCRGVEAEGGRWIFCWRRWCVGGGVARILKTFHFFESCVRLTRAGGKRSCTCGQKWYRTSTYCPEYLLDMEAT